MSMLILSGLGGGSNNPLPLVLPIWIIAALAYFIDFLVRFIKKKRIQHREKLMNDLITPLESADQNPV